MKSKVIILAIFVAFLQTNVESKAPKKGETTTSTAKEVNNYYYNRLTYYVPGSSNRPGGGGGQGSKTQNRPAAKQKQTKPVRPNYYPANNVRPYYPPPPAQKRPGGGGGQGGQQNRPAAKQKQTKPVRPNYYPANNARPYYPPSPAQKSPGNGGGGGGGGRESPAAKQKPTKQKPPSYYFNLGPPSPAAKTPNGVPPMKQPKAPINSPQGPRPTRPNQKVTKSPTKQGSGLPPTGNNGNGNNNNRFGSCRLCSRQWRVPDPKLELMDETCAAWNMKDKGNVYCPDIQATYGSACGCPEAPEPKCNVCPDGDYIWKQFPRYNTFSDDFCVRMIYKMSKHTEYCTGNKRSVAKMCCSGNSPGAKTPDDGKNGKVNRKPKNPKDDGGDNKKAGKEEGASNKLSKRTSSSANSNNKTSNNKTSKRGSSGDSAGARGGGGVRNSNKQTKRATTNSRDFRTPSAARPTPPSRINAGDDGVYPTNNNYGNQGGGEFVYYYYGDDQEDDDYYR